MKQVKDWREMRELMPMASTGRVHKIVSLAKYLRQAIPWLRGRRGQPPMPPEQLEQMIRRLAEERERGRGPLATSANPSGDGAGEVLTAQRQDN